MTITRISGGGLVGAPVFGDPMASQRSTARVADQLSAIGGAAEKIGLRVQRDRENAGNFSARVETARREREFSSDFPEVFKSTPENGEGYAQALEGAWGKRHQQALERVANDPVATEALNRSYELEREEKLKAFQKAERDWRSDYLNDQYLQSLDNSKQRVSRGVYTEDRKYGNGGFKARLAQRETGGIANPSSAVNQFGYTGIYQFGQDHLDYITGKYGLPKMDISEIKGNADLQEQLMDLSIDDMDERLEKRGYDKLIGQRVNGVVITQDGLRAAMHGHGLGNLDKFIKSGENHADGNGMAIAQTMSEFGTDDFGVPNYNGPIPDLTKDEAFQDELSTAYAQIDAMPITALEKKKLKREAEGELTKAALVSMVQTNGPATLALLRSGALDASLDFAVTTDLEGNLINQQRRTLEQQIAAQSKAQIAQDKDEAFRAYKNNIAWHENPVGDQPPPMTDQQLDLLSREQRFNLEKVPAEAAARNLIDATAPEDLPMVLAGLSQHGGDAVGNAAYQVAEQAAEKKYQEYVTGQHIEASAAAGLPVNLSMDGAREILDQKFVSDFDEQNPIGSIEAFAAEYNTLPKSAVDTLAAMMRSENEEDRYTAALSIANMNDENPTSILEMPDELANQAIAISSYLKRGLEWGEASQIVRSKMSKEPDERARRKALGNIKQKDLEKAVKKIVKGEDAAFDPVVMSDLLDTYQQAYLAWGDEAVAADVARRSFRQQYGETRIGGKRMQRYSPEVAYGFNSAAIQGDLKDQLDAAGVVAKDVFLEPVSGTDPRMPAYQVYGEVDGVRQNLSVMGFGEYRPDVEKLTLQAQSDLELLEMEAEIDRLEEQRTVLQRDLAFGVNNSGTLLKMSAGGQTGLAAAMTAKSFDDKTKADTEKRLEEIEKTLSDTSEKYDKNRKKAGRSTFGERLRKALGGLGEGVMISGFGQ